MRYLNDALVAIFIFVMVMLALRHFGISLPQETAARPPLIKGAPDASSTGNQGLSRPSVVDAEEDR